MDGEYTDIIDLINELKVEEKEDPYALVIHNDDQTPMNFVTCLLCDYCDMTPEKAYEYMMKIHEMGSIQLYRAKKETIEKAAILIEKLARSKGHPLKCSVINV